MNDIIEPNHIKAIYLLLTLHIASYYSNKINITGGILIGLSIVLGFILAFPMLELCLFLISDSLYALTIHHNILVAILFLDELYEFFLL